MVRLPLQKAQPKVAKVLLNREQLKKMFMKYDTNNDGKLSWDEVKAAFSDLKAFSPRFRTEQVFRQADKNDDQYINTQDEELEHLVDYALDCGFTIT
jgi:Ca2+-binding EF-hand superfamily protein